MSGRVFITGFGIITSIGKNAEENFQSLVNRSHGFGPIDILDTIHRDTLRACEIKLTEEELEHMAELNPMSVEAWLQRLEAEEFLRGGGDPAALPAPAPAHGHKH